MKIDVLEVQPLRTRRGLCFVDRVAEDGTTEGALASCSVSVYPQATTQQGAKLRLARQAAKLTLGELARELGIAVSTLSSIERGAKTMPDAQWRDLFTTLRARKDGGK